MRVLQWFCGYQKQRRQQPEVWVVAHQLLFRQRPSFIKLDVLAIDEGFHGAGAARHRKAIRDRSRSAYQADRTVPDDAFATNELTEVSRRVHRALAAQPEGRVSRGLLERAYINASTVATGFIVWSGAARSNLDNLIPACR